MKSVSMLAVDLGASGGKCFAGSIGDGTFRMEEVHRFSHEGVPFCLPDKTGSVERRTYWDDVFLYKNIIAAIGNYRRDLGPNLDSIGIDAWGADGHFISADGDMLGKVYCYRDHRLDGMSERVRDLVGARRIYEITGIHFQPFNMSNQLHWFVNNRPDLMLPGCFFLPVPSLFYYYLGGVRMVDSTWASVTQLMDARSKTWSADILARLGIPPAVMPRIVEPGTVVGSLHGELAEMLGVNRARLVAVASHDTASAFAAAPVERTAEALIISSGTWSLLGRLIPKPITTEEAMSLNVSNEGGIGNIRCLKNCMGTWLAQELRRIWRGKDGREPDWPELNRLAEAARPFTTFLDPDDPGFYNPPNMETAIVRFCEKTGQKAPQDRGTMLRAIYESLALKYRTVNEQISRISDTKTKVVHVVGGGCRNEMLNQFTANALNAPVKAGPEEATAIGNLLVQATALAAIPSIEDGAQLVRKAFPLKEYAPAETRAWAWDKAYERFSAICRT